MKYYVYQNAYRMDHVPRRILVHLPILSKNNRMVEVYRKIAKDSDEITEVENTTVGYFFSFKGQRWLIQKDDDENQVVLGVLTRNTVFTYFMPKELNHLFDEIIPVHQIIEGILRSA